MKIWPKTFVACASASRIALRVASRIATQRVTFLVAFLVACGPSAEPQVEVPPPAPTSVLSVTDTWARAADSGATTAVYLTVENTGVVPDTLTGVRTDAAESAGIHMSMEMEGMMHMAALRALPVPAQDMVMFRPMGAHLMLTRLNRPFAYGDTVTVTLQFASGKSIEVRAGVRADGVR